MRFSLLLLSLVLTSCGMFRQTRVPPSPGPIPVKLSSRPIVAAPAPTRPLPEPPPLQAGSTAKVEQVLPSVDLPETKRPPAPRRRRVQSRRPAAVAVLPPSAEPTPTAEAISESEATPLLQLGEVLGPQQRADLLRQTEQLLAVCEKAVTTATPRSLDAAQTDLLSRVRSLSQLSRDARERSPAEARNLAERARLFADRLLDELRE